MDTTTTELKSVATADERVTKRCAAEAPAVSVIIPAYNVASFINETLTSVFTQTFTDYEVIVVNDGSPDTPQLEIVLRPYLDRIKYVKQENRGLSGARNTGIHEARGEFVALLDSDDAWEPEYLAVQIATMRRDPSIDVLYCDAYIFGDGVRAGQKFTDGSPSNGEVSFESLVQRRCNVMVSVTARREILLSAGSFDESLRSSEDFDMWLRIVKAGGRIAYHNRPLARYRRRPDSLSADPVWMCKHILAVFAKAERTMDLSACEADVLRREQARLQSELCLHEGKRAFLKGEYDAAVRQLTEANRLSKNAKLTAALVLLRFAPGTLRRVYDLRDRFVFRANTKV